MNTLENLLVAENLNRSRAAALVRETELRRSLADRGIELHPEPPFVAALHRLGRSFRRRFRGGRMPRVHAAH